MAVLAVSYASSMRAWLKQRSDINTLTAEIAEQQASVDSLKRDKTRLHDPAYIETLAKQRFGWVMPGEISYKVIGADGEVLSDGTSQLSDPTDVLPKDDPEWWEDAWGTVVEAGKDPAEVAAEEQQPQRTPADRIGGGQHSPSEKHDR